MKKAVSLIAALLCLGTSLCVSAKVPYNTYTYSTQTGSTEAVYSPTAYYPAYGISKSSLGITLSSPCAMCFDKNDCLYVVDCDGNKVVVLNPDYSLRAVIETFDTEDGLGDFLSAPEGIFVTDNLDIYICDTGNKRVLVLDSEYKIKRIYENIVPVGGNIMSDDDYSFSPTKIAVDESGNMYILVKNEYQGILQVDSEGNFISFLGSNKVTFDPVTRLWKKIMSKEQNAQMEQFLPVEYTNISLDSEGLILTVSKADEVSPVKRLNLSGKDVLIRNGYIDVVGDIFDDDDASSLVDITGDGNGVIYILDSFKGRVFVYNSEGYMYYAFGTLGTQFGAFSQPSDIEVRGGDILVCDSGNQMITVFKRTEYAELIYEADMAYNNAEYEESIKKWNDVIKLNSNFELAYAQIGKVYLRQNKYTEAMEYFELGNCRGDTVTKSTGYNKAFSEYRRAVASDWLAPAVIAVLVIAAGIKGVRLYRRRRKNEGKN